ncbi:WS/DGAT domain-containing protein, partial [Streptomyces albogriseolus]
MSRPGSTLRQVCGSSLRQVGPWVRPGARAPGHSLAVAVSTYRGRVHYGLVADGAAVEDLDLLARAVTEEVTALTVACDH